MNKTYIITLAICGILTVFASFPDMVFLVMSFTGGLGQLVFVAAINLFFGLFFFLPLALKLGPERVQFGASGLLVVVYLIGPGVMSDYAARAIVQNEVGADTQRTNDFLAETALGLELIRPANVEQDLPDSLITDDICGDLCQRALHGGQVDWVRIITENPRAGRTPTVSMVQRGETDDCRDTLCFIYVSVLDIPADITIELEQRFNGPVDINFRPKGWATIRGLNRLTIIDGSRETGQTIWRQTDLQLINIDKLAFLVPTFDMNVTGDDRGGLHFYRSPMPGNRIDVDVAVAQVGLTLAPASPDLPLKRYEQPPPPPSKTVEMASLLDQEGFLTRPAWDEIHLWASDLNRASTLSDAQINLLMRMANDPRLPEPIILDAVFNTHPTLQSVMLPWVFDKLDNDPTFKPRLISSLASGLHVAHYYSDEQLAPHGSRFLELVMQDDHTELLIDAIGRFDFDPAPQLALLYEKRDISRRDLMEGICRSNPQWHAGLVPLVREILTTELRERPRDQLQGITKWALEFLISTGHRQEVVTIIEASNWSNRLHDVHRGFASDDPGTVDNPRQPCGVMRY